MERGELSKYFEQDRYIKLREFLTGLEIGTREVPILEVGELEPVGGPNDVRRTLTVKLLILDGDKLATE